MILSKSERTLLLDFLEVMGVGTKTSCKTIIVKTEEDMTKTLDLFKAYKNALIDLKVFYVIENVYYFEITIAIKNERGNII